MSLTTRLSPTPFCGKLELLRSGLGFALRALLCRASDEAPHRFNHLRRDGERLIPRQRLAQRAHGLGRHRHHPAQPRPCSMFPKRFGRLDGKYQLGDNLV